MKPQEIREMSEEQIRQELAALERRVFDLRTQAETEELQISSELSKARQDIARMRTILRERELAGLAQTVEGGEERKTP